MGYVFISYSTKNTAYAQRLAKKLRAEGIEVWIDNARIRSGEEWWQAIVEALTGASAIIVIMTPAAFESDWVKRETLLAEQLKKRVFPVLLEGENWPLFVHIQYADVRKFGGLPRKSFFEEVRAFIQIHVNVTVNASTMSNSMPPPSDSTNPITKKQINWRDPVIFAALITLIGAVITAVSVTAAAIIPLISPDASLPNAPTNSPLPAFTDTPTSTIAPTDMPQSRVLLPTETNTPSLATSTDIFTPVALPTNSNPSATFTVNVARGRGVVVLTVERPTDLSDLVIDFDGNETYRLGDELANPLVTEMLCIRQPNSTTPVDGCTEANTFTTGFTGNDWRNAEIIFMWRGAVVEQCDAQSTVTTGLYACDPLVLTF